MSHGSGKGKAGWTVAGGGLLVTAMMVVATVPSEGWSPMAALLPIGFSAGAIAGGLLAGTLWYSGVE